MGATGHGKKRGWWRETKDEKKEKKARERKRTDRMYLRRRVFGLAGRSDGIRVNRRCFFLEREKERERERGQATSTGCVDFLPVNIFSPFHFFLAAADPSPLSSRSLFSPVEKCITGCADRAPKTGGTCAASSSRRVQRSLTSASPRKWQS